VKTIKDIAKLAGVSQSTVSKALNNRPDIGEETRKRILEIVKEHNFSPNAFGKGLKSRLSENIGVIFCRYVQPLTGNPFYSRVLEGVEAEIAINDQFMDEIVQTNIPLVFVDPKQILDGYSQILIDNEHGAFDATQYLIRRGHRKIGFVSGELERLSFQQRFNGYKKALKANHIEVDEKLIKTGGLEEGYEHVKAMMVDEKPTAIFAGNDINAIYGYKAVGELGMKIPDDISIVGFDDIDLCRFSTPQLTTVRENQPLKGGDERQYVVHEFSEVSEESWTKFVHVKNEKGFVEILGGGYEVLASFRNSTKYHAYGRAGSGSGHSGF